MVAQLKYLISLLLILGLTVNEAIGYSQESSTSYHQSYKTISLKKFSNKNTKLITSKKSILSDRKVFVFFFTNFSLQERFSKQIQTSYKLQTVVYQQINSVTKQQVFLNKVFTSSNSFTPIYIA